MADSPAAPPQNNRLHSLHQKISIGTWLIVLLLSLRGIFEIYGMKVKGDLELAVGFVTEPLVQLFSFQSIQALNLPAITVLFATISVLLASFSLQLIVRYTEIRYTRARRMVLKQLAITPIRKNKLQTS